jgi:hypothetical protein
MHGNPRTPRQGESPKEPWITWEWLVLIAVVLVALILGALAMRSTRLR